MLESNREFPSRTYETCGKTQLVIEAQGSSLTNAGVVFTQHSKSLITWTVVAPRSVETDMVTATFVCTVTLVHICANEIMYTIAVIGSCVGIENTSVYLTASKI